MTPRSMYSPTTTITASRTPSINSDGILCTMVQALSRACAALQGSCEAVARYGPANTSGASKVHDGDEYNRRLRAGSPEMYNYSAYPALLVFQDGEHEFYRGGREPEDIVFYMSALAKGLTLTKRRKSKGQVCIKKSHITTLIMIDLEPEFFNETVLSKSKENNVLWIVEFYSDRCPFCKSLAPEIEKAAKAIKKKFPDEIRFGGVNSRIYHDLAERHGITGYPWVTSFYMGKKVEDMAGLGGADSVINWATSKHAAVWKKDSGEDIPYDDGVAKALASLKNGGAHTANNAEKTVEVAATGEAKPASVDIDTLDLEQMVTYAMEYNIMSLKNVQKMRQAIRKRKTTEDSEGKNIRKGPVITKPTKRSWKNLSNSKE